MAEWVVGRVMCVLRMCHSGAMVVSTNKETRGSYVRIMIVGQRDTTSVNGMSGRAACDDILGDEQVRLFHGFSW